MSEPDYPHRYEDTPLDSGPRHRRLNPAETYHRLEYELYDLWKKRQEVGEQMRQTWAKMTPEERSKAQRPPPLVHGDTVMRFLQAYRAPKEGSDGNLT